MPKIMCKCGESLSYSEIPCNIQYKFISDVDYDKYRGMIDAEALYQQMRSFIKCLKCGRLWIFWDGNNHLPSEYIKINN